MSKGLGRVERGVLLSAAKDAMPSDWGPGTVMLLSGRLFDELFRPRGGAWNNDWKPTPAQRKAVIRAMHSVVRKFPKYALTGGKGRGDLYLYEPGDPLSVMWTKLNIERGGGNPISKSVAKRKLYESE